jgi:hypothetical protein
MLEPLVLLGLLSSRTPWFVLHGDNFGGMTSGLGLMAWTSVNNRA